MTANREEPRQEDQPPDPVRLGFEEAVVEANLALREELEERTAALDAAESRFRAIVGASEDGIVVVDRDGNVLFMNPAATTVLDKHPHELTGQPLGVPVSADRPDLIEIVDRRGQIHTYQMRVVETEWQGSTARLITLHDVTAIKSAELLLKEAVGRLEEVNELKNEFVGMVVHDMKTPLTIITGFVQALQRNWEKFSDERKKELLVRLERRASELDRMVTDTLQVAQIEASQFNYRIAPFDLAAMVERTSEAIRTVARQARIEVSLPDGIPSALGDEARYAQVLLNLLTNAIKYARDPATIDVEVRLVANMLRVTVADNGEGITPDEMPKLFKRFSRLRQHDNVEGTGLGLYICKRMVEDQKGRLWAESELGTGSRFSFTIPIA
ncbi:MAG TPA: PAS domain-containing sensor histidine kinase [Actinomycetota bacterium]|nr:PAS domain-containing sensor histidine kinase [Actinomycetota bacterium]